MPTNVPLKDENRDFTVWGLSQLYTPGSLNKYLPNTGDFVIDKQTGFFFVTDVDYTANTYELEPWNIPGQGDGIIPEDVLLGSGSDDPSKTFRVLINNDAVPHVLAVEGRLHMFTSKVEYCKIFRGTDIGPNGIVISAILDQNGDIVTENLPMELVQNPAGGNIAVKSVVQGYSVESVPDGETVTAVFYSATGVKLSATKLLVMETNFIRNVDASRKFITGIDLISNYLDPSNNRLIKYPVNMLLQSSAVSGRLSYSDGSELIMPIDGTRFQLLGWGNYVSSNVGQRFPLTLQYNLADNEQALDLDGSVPGMRFKQEQYHIETTEIAGGYSVKLYAVPVWQNPIDGYKLEWYLYNLDRETFYYVTPYVNLVAPNAAYNPLPTGGIQTILARIELSTLGASFNYYAHTQLVTLSLLTPGTSSSANWWVQYTPAGPQYGGANAAVIASTGPGTYSVNLAAGKATTEEWLNAVFYNAEPIIHPTTESKAPTPTHVRIRIGASFTREIAIADWNTPQGAVSLTAPDPAAGDIVYLEFILRSGMDVQELGLGYMPIHLDV